MNKHVFITNTVTTKMKRVMIVRTMDQNMMKKNLVILRFQTHAQWNPNGIRMESSESYLNCHFGLIARQ